MELQTSATRLNLLRAFAGECQAAQRYRMAGAKAGAAQLHVVREAFDWTEHQEREHAEIFFRFLAGAAGENLRITADYPIADPAEPLALLTEARHNEYEEYERVYPQFSQVAAEEGFTEIAAAFSNIARIEKTHGDRFGRYAEALRAGTLFADKQPTVWMCINCGHVLTAASAPAICPVCQHNQGYFTRENLQPFW